MWVEWRRGTWGKEKNRQKKKSAEAKRATENVFDRSEYEATNNTLKSPSIQMCKSIAEVSKLTTQSQKVGSKQIYKQKVLRS